MKFTNVILYVAVVATILSCKSDPAMEPEPYVPVHLAETPIEDVVGNALPHPALFMGSNSSMEYMALKRRLSLVSNAGLEDQDLHTLVIGICAPCLPAEVTSWYSPLMQLALPNLHNTLGKQWTFPYCRLQTCHFQ